MNRSLARRWLGLGLCAVLLGACTYRGADDPVSRKFSWFSYLNGDDIRRECAAGGPDRYRFVYNGINVEQIRTYDLSLNAGPQGNLLSVRVLGPADVSHIGVSSPGDLLGPWQGDRGQVWLLDRDVARLEQAMADSGVFAPPPRGMRMQSYDFFWLTVGCRQGQVFFDARRWPSEPFTAATFPDLLFGWDRTGVAVNPPRQANPRQVYPDKPDERSDNYELRVGDDGLIGGLGLF